MIVAFSFCDKDRLMAIELAMHIECLGGTQNHRLMLFRPSDVSARGIAEPLKRAFGTIIETPYPPTLKGWPDGPNQAFQVACETIIRLPLPDTPWLWLEADCVPTTPRWLDLIEAAYRAARMPILGVLNTTVDGAGKPVGEHVTGVAVYPKNFLKLCPIVRNLVTMSQEYRRGGGRCPAFDCYIAGYAVKNCAQTKIIRHYWKSHDFTEDQHGNVTCQFQQPYGAELPVDMTAPLLHGAKDFSLLDIVQRRLCAPLTP